MWYESVESRIVVTKASVSLIHVPTLLRRAKSTRHSRIKCSSYTVLRRSHWFPVLANTDREARILAMADSESRSAGGNTARNMHDCCQDLGCSRFARRIKLGNGLHVLFLGAWSVNGCKCRGLDLRCTFFSLRSSSWRWLSALQDAASGAFHVVGHVAVLGARSSDFSWLGARPGH